MRLIIQKREACLCDILAKVDLPQPNMSRHMSMLRRAGLVLDRRDARWVRYRRNTDLDKDLARIVDAVLQAAEAEPAIDMEEDVAA
jgi:ArsR family transcriptional regulator